MHSLTIVLLCLVVSVALSKSISDPECGPVCAIYCLYGNVFDDKGCPACQCKESPCANGQPPLSGYFCGRGPNNRACPSTHQCMVAPNDAYAVCCPR
jgi:hypothetical protein